MRILVISIALSLSLSLSCSDKNTSGNNMNAAILGQWYNTSFVVNGELTPYPHSENCERDYIIFNVDETLEEGEYDTDCSVTISEGLYNIDRNRIQITIDTDQGPRTISGILSVTSHILSITINEVVEEENVVMIINYNR